MIVCPCLKVLRIFGNPLVEKFSKAPPGIKTVLVENCGISVECERSKIWFPGKTKSTPQRNNRLPPLKLSTEGVEEESTSKSGDILESNECPLLPQLEMSINYTELSKGDIGYN